MNNIYLLLFIQCSLLVNLGFKVGIVEGIVGGRLANRGEFKAVVSIWTNGHYVCTGSIIGDKYVLAVVRCVLDENNRFANSEFAIRAGIINFNDSPIATAIVDTIYVPKGYGRRDLAVLRLNQRLNTSQEVRILKLPRPQNEHFPELLQVTAYIVGFGANENNQHIGRNDENIADYQEICGQLKVAQTNTLSRYDCIIHYGLLEHRHICAKVEPTNGNPSGTCHGDSGSPLIYNGNTIIGVLAQNTPSCNEAIQSSLYTRVTSYRSLISQAINDEDNQLGDEIFDDVCVVDWICRSGICSMIQRT